jgi:hypothetical protein
MPPMSEEIPDEDLHDALHYAFAVFARYDHPFMMAGSQGVRWMGVNACADMVGSLDPDPLTSLSAH